MFSGSRDRSGSTFSSYKGTNPIRLGAYPYDLIFSFLTSLEALSPNTVTWGFRASAYKFWGHIQSIIQTKKKKTHLNESSYRIFSCTCTNGKILKTILANKISYIYIWLNIMYLYIKICMCVCVGGFPGSASDRQVRPKRHRFDSWVKKIPWRRAWQPTPVFLPEEYGQRSLVGCSP